MITARRAVRGQRVPPFVAVEEGLGELRRGGMVILCRSEEPSTEGSLLMGAEWASPGAISFMARAARGLICVALTRERCRLLGLSAVLREDTSAEAVAISFEARAGISTGISAYDRAHTIQIAVDPSATAQDIVVPGHVFPLCARPGGLVRHQGRVEAAIELTRAAGLLPAGVLCEVVNPDGSMSKLPELESYGEQHGLKILSIPGVHRFYEWKSSEPKELQ